VIGILFLTPRFKLSLSKVGRPIGRSVKNWSWNLLGSPRLCSIGLIGQISTFDWFGLLLFFIAFLRKGFD
jgi:hypothetical protein